MKSTKTIQILKHVVYALLLALFYVAQTTPGLFVIAGVKPMWVVPVAIAIAMYEGEFVGGIYGAAAGLLCDAGTVPRAGGGAVLFGFNGFFVCLFCIAAGLLIIYLLRCNLLGCMLFVAVTMLARGSLEFLFAYGMWGHENVWKLYVYYTIPVIVYTLVITPLVFWSVGKIFRKFEIMLER